MNLKNIPAIMKILSKEFPSNEQTTLNRMRKKPNAFKVLISCLLSLRAKDETTEVISQNLFKIADTPQTILKIPTRKLEKIIFSTGHYRKKARVLKHVCKELIERFESKVPKTREELMSIKGVGLKTANVVLAFAFGQQVVVVDTPVHRISNRIGFVKTKNADKTEPELTKILPKKYVTEINGIFILFGREICQPVSPWCSKCPIKKYCSRVGVKRSR
ncbi:endonuclease III [Candidatus Pacearchaeota archaeon]|nr:endonuclease III [Candidatus Pacearchaeota archaeon]